MKYNVFILFSILSSLLYAEQKVTLTHVDGSVYLSQDYFFALENSVVYIGEEYVTIVGATWTPHTAELLHHKIRQITDKPVQEVINTNYHPDRTGGNAYWKTIGATIHATSKTAELLQTGWEDVMNSITAGFPDFSHFPAVMPDCLYVDHFELQNGTVQAFYLGPTHTEDGIFVYFPNEKVLYGGCILKEFLGSLRYANLQEYPETLKKLKKLNLDISTIVAGHGRPIHGPDLIDHYQHLLEQHIVALTK